MNLNDAIAKDLLSKIAPSKDLIDKELNESRYDLKRAEESFNKGDYKWGIVKSYYAMFHCVRALMFKHGYKDRKHAGVVIFLEEFEKQGIIDSSIINDYKAALSAREGADYRYTYNEITAKNIMQIAKEFISKMKNI